jgi:hypothetical protein
MSICSAIQSYKDNEPERQKLFARFLLLYPTNPRRAAIAAFGDDYTSINTALSSWLHSDVIVKYQEELRAANIEAELLPTREAFAHEVLELARQAYGDTGDKVKAFKLVADVLGYADKKLTQTADKIVNNVMQVNNYGSNAEWETSVRAQQAKLVNAS